MLQKRNEQPFLVRRLYSAQNPFLKNETSYPLEPYGCTRHKTHFMDSYYSTLVKELRGDVDNTGYIRS